MFFLKERTFFQVVRYIGQNASSSSPSGTIDGLDLSVLVIVVKPRPCKGTVNACKLLSSVIPDGRRQNAGWRGGGKVEGWPLGTEEADQSGNTTQLRPLRLASYIARSARLNAAS